MTNPDGVSTPVPPAGAPAATRKTGVWQLVLGIVLIFASLFSFPRGIIGIIVTTTQPGMVNPGYPAGIALFGAVLLGLGIWLLVISSRIRAANRAAGAAAAGSATPPPAP